jgi:hypothetical protein
VPAGFLLGAVVTKSDAAELRAGGAVVEAVIGEQDHVEIPIGLEIARRRQQLAEHAVLFAVHRLDHPTE